jgi:hypothetical protein
MYTVLGTMGTMHKVWGIVEIMRANAGGYKNFACIIHNLDNIAATRFICFWLLCYIAHLI